VQPVAVATAARHECKRAASCRCAVKLGTALLLAVFDLIFRLRQCVLLLPFESAAREYRDFFIVSSPLAFLPLSSTIATTMATTATKEGAFAVIMTGGKQYVVSAGDTLEVELLGDHKEGDTITFDTVLMTDDGAKANVGAPYTGSKVTATYLGETKGPKLSIIRFKAKSNRDRKLGHRQHYAKIKIETI
jgi:large subunit ribosomal protein L21